MINATITKIDFITLCPSNFSLIYFKKATIPKGNPTTSNSHVAYSALNLFLKTTK